MNKIEKELIHKAADRYSKRMRNRLYPMNFYQAFLDGISWYKRNRDKIGEHIAMDDGGRILNAYY